MGVSWLAGWLRERKLGQTQLKLDNWGMKKIAVRSFISLLHNGKIFKIDFYCIIDLILRLRINSIELLVNLNQQGVVRS